MQHRNLCNPPVFLLIVFVAVALGRCPDTKGCAIVSHPGDQSVAIVEENVIIIWDPATKTQHFIRQATFQANSRDFGFLVPTPNVPQLAEADATAFERLQEAIKPKRIEKRNYKLHATLFEVLRSWTPDSIFTNVDSSIPTGSASSEVEVVLETTVAGFKAVVLRANDSEALVTWLKSNGYESGPDTAEWMQPYVDGGWLITAFKYEKEGNASAPTLETAAIRMSFGTERPFFPYREPPRKAAPRHAMRTLNIYMVAPAQMAGTLEGSDFDWNHFAKLKFASAKEDLQVLLSGTVPRDLKLKNRWLTVLEDTFSRQPLSGDLYFEPTLDQVEKVPPPIIVAMPDLHIPLCADMAIGLLLVRGLRKATARIFAQRTMPVGASPR